MSRFSLAGHLWDRRSVEGSLSRKTHLLPEVKCEICCTEMCYALCNILNSPLGGSILGTMFNGHFLKKILFIFRERGREGETEGEKHQRVVTSYVSPTGDVACNPGLCPDWESNRQRFGSQAHVQSTELHQPRQPILFF